MDITKHDGIMLLYNFAVVVTGGYAVLTMDIGDRWTMFAFAFVFAIIWTIYFKFAMLRRLADHPRFARDEGEDEAKLPM